MSLAFAVYNMQVISLLLDYLSGSKTVNYAEDQMKLEWILNLAVIPIVIAISLMNEFNPRWLILCLSTIVITVLTKFIAPMTSFGWFVIQLASRSAFYGLMVNPLVNDFIKKESIGVGVAIETTGYAIGQLIVGIQLVVFYKAGSNGFKIT